jgi:hypothetical protein
LEDKVLGAEQDFSLVVLTEAKKFFEPHEQRILGQSRMEKLVAYVADDVGYSDLTRGWYKFGLYAPSAWSVSKKYANGGNLQQFSIPSSKIRLREFSNILPKIRKSIYNLKKNFILEKNSFYEWVYSTSPREYRNFYLSKMRFENNFEEFKVHYSHGYSLYFEDEYWSQIKLISDLYKNIEHVSDIETIDIFHDYMDLLEMVLLKIKILSFKQSKEMVSVLDTLLEAFRGENGLLTLLVPFKETLIGRDAEDLTRWMDSKISSSKEFLPSHIEALYEEARRHDLLPTKEELEADIKNYKPLRRKSIREMI